LLIALESDAIAEALQAVGAVVWVEQEPHQDRWNLGVAFAEITD
jgi:hypothetical protein